VGPVCGYFFGHFLDQRFATDPWFMVFFVVIGAISGVREMILLMKKAAKDG
jgi:F0F1-type ATP synthase assembly protein I